jgi:tetratricopeptide (TPR) repeat protein
VRAHTFLASHLRERNRRADAEKEFRTAAERGTALLRDQPNAAPALYEMSATCHNFATLLGDLGRRDEATRFFEQAQGYLEKLVKMFPYDRHYKRDLANTLVHLGRSLAEAGTPGAAEPLRRGVDLFRDLLKPQPENVPARRDLLRSLGRLAVLHGTTGKPAEAEEEFEEALALGRALAAAAPDMPSCRYELSSVSHNYGSFLLDVAQRPRAAESAFRHAEGLLRKLADDAGETPHYRRDLANTRLELGMSLVAQGKTEEAGKPLRLAEDDWKWLADHHPDVPDYPRAHLRTKGERLLARGQHASAAAAAEELARLATAGVPDFYNAACLAARCVPLAEKDEELAAEKRREQADTYAARAVALLGEAVKRGFTDAEKVRRDSDLSSLRARPEFQKLVQEMAKEKK